MSKSDDEDLIRSGMKSIPGIVANIVAARNQLLGETASTAISVDDVLEFGTFIVGDRAFTGRLARPQILFLHGQTKNLETFALGVAKILLFMNSKIVGLFDAFDSPDGKIKAMSPGGPIGAKTGCCTYDSGAMTNGVLEPICTGSIAGNWSEGPCGNI
jgi:hypothetical protein